jgi:hypothetical protein
MKAFLIIAGCVLTVCLVMVVMDMDAGDVAGCYHLLAFAYILLAFVLWFPTYMILLDVDWDDDYFHKVLIKYKVLTANHIATLILVWPHVISLILQTRHGLWALAGVLLWHAWLEWARKKVSG